MSQYDDALAAPYEMVQRTGAGDIVVTAEFAGVRGGLYRPTAVRISRADGGEVDAATLRAVKIGALREQRCRYLMREYPPPSRGEGDS